MARTHPRKHPRACVRANTIRHTHTISCTYLLTQSSSCGSVHKADTRARHCSLSLDVFSSFPTSGYVLSFLTPSFFSKFLSVFLSPVFHLLFHLRAVRTIAVSGILKTWPIHCHLCRFISYMMGWVDVLLWSSTFEMVLGQNILNILRRHLF